MRWICTAGLVWALYCLMPSRPYYTTLRCVYSVVLCLIADSFCVQKPNVTILIADETCFNIAPAIFTVIMMLKYQIRATDSLKHIETLRPRINVTQSNVRGIMQMQKSMDDKILARLDAKLRHSNVMSSGFWIILEISKRMLVSLELVRERRLLLTGTSLQVIHSVSHRHLWRCFHLARAVNPHFPTELTKTIFHIVNSRHIVTEFECTLTMDWISCYSMSVVLDNSRQAWDHLTIYDAIRKRCCY